MESRKFGLAENVFLVTGAKRAAIYNLEDGNVYSIDQEARKLLELCEQGLSPKAIFTENPELNRGESIEYLNKLAESKLGRYLEAGEKIQKVDINKDQKLLSFIWLELTAGCNLKCVHCYAGSNPSLIGKDRMSIQDWLSVIDQVSDLGCKKLQFIGGEPLILGENLIRLIKYARKRSFAFVEVFTNATILTDRMLDALKEHKVNVAVSFYGDDPAIHERITLGKNSHAHTVSNVKRMLAAGLEVRAGIVGMIHNQDNLEETKCFLTELGIPRVGVDLVRPSGRGCNNDLVPTKLISSTYLTRPVFPKCTKEIFTQRHYGHNCFSKKVCVGPSGDVYPCIMERDMSYGNVLETSLENILKKGRAQRIRQLSKDHIEICRDCEYRYACFDCRPKAKNMDKSGSFVAKPTECLYSPYLGEWGSLEETPT
ncbi:MAG: radical SAM protein [Patescibacteria group bacterium]